MWCDKRLILCQARLHFDRIDRRYLLTRENYCYCRRNRCVDAFQRSPVKNVCTRHRVTQWRNQIDTSVSRSRLVNLFFKKLFQLSLWRVDGVWSLSGIVDTDFHWIAGYGPTSALSSFKKLGEEGGQRGLPLTSYPLSLIPSLSLYHLNSPSS